MSHLRRTASLASVVCHPVVLMTVAAAIAGDGDASGPRRPWLALGLTLAAAALVMGYSAWQARSGRWSHIDASQPAERSQLNRFASWMLLAFAVAAVVVGAHRGIAAALGLSGLMVLTGHLLRTRLKLSLHVAFATFAACIVWPDRTAFAALLVATAVVGWSRLVLRRHRPADVAIGAAVGLACGVAFHGLLRAGPPPAIF